MPLDKLFETFGSPQAVLGPVRIIGNEKEQPPFVGIPFYMVIPAWFGIRSENIKLLKASVMLAAPLTVRPPKTRFAPEKLLLFAANI